MTRLALIGYGAMGRLVEQLAPEHGFEVALRFGGAEGRAGVPIDGARLRGVDELERLIDALRDGGGAMTGLAEKMERLLANADASEAA